MKTKTPLLKSLSLLAGTLVASSAFATITFGGTTTLSTPQRPDWSVSADFNGDLRPDVAVSTDAPDKVTFYFATPTGFSGPVNVLFPAGSAPGGLVAADYDSDGDQDLAVALKNVNQLSILLNNGNGTFTNGPSTAVGDEPVQLITMQLNADARPDFATVNRSANSVTVISNTLGGLVTSSIAVGNDPRNLAAGDFDNDGDSDLAVSNHDDRTISILRNTAGTMASSALISTGAVLRPSGLATGDLDNDGDIDLAAATSGNALNFVSIYRNTAGTLALAGNFNPGGINPGDLSVFDADCDGLLDVAVTNQDSSNVGVLTNLGTLNFGAPLILATGANPGSPAAGDADHDGDLDLVVTSRDTNTSVVLLNTSCTPLTLASSFELILGSVFGGSPANIGVSDNNRLSLFVDPVLNVVSWGINGSTSVLAPTSMTLVFEGSVTDANQSLGVQMWNWTTSAWQFAAGITGSTTETRSTAVVLNPARFVSSTGQVRARFTTAAASEDSAVDGFTVNIDQVGWIIN